MARLFFSLRLLAPLALALSVTACATDSRVGQRFISGRQTADSAVGDYLQGQFAASQNAYGRAASAFDRAASEDQSDRLLADAFRYALAAGNYSDAARYAERIIAQSTNVDPVTATPAIEFAELDMPRLLLAATYFSDEDYASAQKTLNAPFQSRLGQSVSFLLMAWAINAEEGFDEALVFMAAPPKGMYLGYSTIHMAMMADLAGQPEVAAAAYAQSLQGPGADLAVVAFSEFLERTEETEKALDFHRTLAADRGYFRRVGRMGLVRLDQPLEGESKAFSRIAKRAPIQLADSPKSGAALAVLNFAWSAYEQGMRSQEQAVAAGYPADVVPLDVPLTLAQLTAAIDQDLGAAHYIIGAIAGSYDNHEMAEKANRNVLPTSWLYNYATIDRAAAMVRLGQPKKAIRLIKDYLAQDALAPDVALTLAELLAEQGRYDEAAEAAQHAIDIASGLANKATYNDNLWRYHFARGAILSDGGNWELAEPELVRALELAPDEAMVLNFLGYSYVERGEQLEEATAMIEKALEERPTSGSITDSLGWAYYQRGAYDKAVRALEQAVTLEPGNDVITDHLGDAYWFAGRKIQARYEWRRVLKIEDLDPELAKTVQAKLDGSPPTAGAWAGAATSTK